MKQQIKQFAKSIPLLRRVARMRRDLKEAEQMRQKLYMAPGHFYSPVSVWDDTANYNPSQVPESILAVDLNAEKQLETLRQFAAYYPELPFTPQKTEGLRYFYDNENYSYADAIFLYSMLRHVQPAKIIEVGSGFSSCVTLDTNEKFFGDSISCTFIEPYPDLLRSLLKPADFAKISILPSDLQKVDTKLFSSLQQNDILFIDSTHVSKFNSDVNYIFFEILPRLNSGVYIHFHDIFHPFEYPLPWLKEGRSWNEDYMLRAFLQYNAAFEVIAFCSYLQQRCKEEMEAALPLCANSEGGNIWLRKK